MKHHLSSIQKARERTLAMGLSIAVCDSVPGKMEKGVSGFFFFFNMNVKWKNLSYSKLLVSPQLDYSLRGR